MHLQQSELDTQAATLAAAQAADGERLAGQLRELRDEWLAPLMALVARQAEEIGRLTAERDAACTERDSLGAELASVEREARIQTSHNYLRATERHLQHVDTLHREIASAGRLVAAVEQRGVENELGHADDSQLIQELRLTVHTLESSLTNAHYVAATLSATVSDLVGQRDTQLARVRDLESSTPPAGDAR